MIVVVENDFLTSINSARKHDVRQRTANESLMSIRSIFIKCPVKDRNNRLFDKRKESKTFADFMIAACEACFILWQYTFESHMHTLRFTILSKSQPYHTLAKLFVDALRPSVPWEHIILDAFSTLSFFLSSKLLVRSTSYDLLYVDL